MKKIMPIVFISVLLFITQSSLTFNDKPKKTDNIKLIHTKNYVYSDDGSKFIEEECMAYHNKRGGTDSLIFVYGAGAVEFFEQNYYNKNNRLDSIIYYGLKSSR